MSHHALSKLSNRLLLQALASLLAHDRTHTVALLEHLAEVERRKLYVPAGYPSMYRYCIGELHMSEETSSKRIRAARAVRRFPAVSTALLEGRVHLYGIALLAKYLKPDNVDALLVAAEHRTGRQIECLIAERFPKEDAPTKLVPIVPMPPEHPAGPRGEVRLGSDTSARLDATDSEVNDMSALPSARTVVALPSHESMPAMGPLRTEPPTYPRVTPTSPGRFALQVTLDRRTNDLLCRAQELLGQGSPAAEISQVLERALGDHVKQLEYERFAATDDARARRSSGDGRYIPADMKRKVAERDAYQCAFVSDRGHRCEERSGLQYDHVLPVARGGRTTVDNLRLLCLAHNQYEAERVYGEGFMRAKREAAGHQADCVRERALGYASMLNAEGPVCERAGPSERVRRNWWEVSSGGGQARLHPHPERKPQRTLAAASKRCAARARGLSRAALAALARRHHAGGHHQVNRAPEGIEARSCSRRA